MRQAFRCSLTAHESLDGFRYPFNQQALDGFRYPFDQQALDGFRYPFNQQALLACKQWHNLDICGVDFYPADRLNIPIKNSEVLAMRDEEVELLRQST